MGLLLSHSVWQIDRQVMGQCETLTVSNLLAHEWAIHSLIYSPVSYKHHGTLSFFQ